MSSPQNKYCFVQFKLCQKTSPGEEIHITGNIPSLGQWEVYKSEKMVTSQQDYPLWKSKENIIVQQDTEIQYKYLIFREGKFISWENSANRRVKIGKYWKIVIMDPGSKIVHSISDPNLNNITNSEISKSENNFYEDDSKFINIDDTNIFNNSIELNNNENFSDQNMITINNEEQFILSNKKNDLFLLKSDLNQLYQELNVNNSNQNLIIRSESNNTLNNSHLNNLNNSVYTNKIGSIVNEIAPINSQIFNNINQTQNKIENNNELDLGKMDSNNSETEKTLTSGEMPLIDNTSSKKDLTLNTNNNNKNNNKNSLYQKIIICSLFLPVEIEDDDKITLKCDNLYPNLYEFKKYNDNVYYIGFLNNNKNIKENNKDKIYKKLKNEYKMYPLEIDTNFANEIYYYFNEIANPFINNIKININNIKNNNINCTINDIHYKFNEIIYKNIIELSGEEKTLLLLLDYYFIFVPFLLMKEENDIKMQKDKNNKINNNNMTIQYMFFNQIPQKYKFIKIPNYENIINSLLYCNIIVFPSYYNCFNFLNLTKLIESTEYQSNINGDIILSVNSNNNNNQNKSDDNNNSDCLQKNKNIILKIENPLPDYQLLKSIYNEGLESTKTLEIKEKINNLNKNNDCFIFLSIDDIKYLSLIKIKLIGFKSFIENILDEKQKIIFIQVLTGSSNNQYAINSNTNVDVNNEKKEKEKENENKITVEEINKIANEVNSYSENKIIEIIQKDLNIYEKLFLLNNADCFIKTSDDINSPFSIYEYMMVKIIGYKNDNEQNIENKNISKLNHKYKVNKNNEKKTDYPIIEYIISNQIKEIPGINKYIYVNPFEIKNISIALTKAFRNLINYHKNYNNNINFNEEHSKENDFNYIKNFFYKEKSYYYKINNNNLQNPSTKINTINDNINKITLNKIDINNVIKDYSDSINNKNDENQNNNKDKDNNNNNINKTLNYIYNKIIIINLDYFLSKYSSKKEDTTKNQKLYELFSHLISLSSNNINNNIILFSSKDQFELDNIIENYIEHNKQKFKETPLGNHLKNLIIGSSDGYSFKKISNYFEEEEKNRWTKIFVDTEELKYSEKDIMNNLASYRNNCNNIKIFAKSNKIFIYNDDCNKEQIDIYMERFKNEIDNNDNLKHILMVNKISNGYCIVNTLNYKALFISRLIKEIISKERQPKFFLHLGFNQSDEILYKYLDEKKSTIEKYFNTNIYIYCIKLISSEESINKNNEQNSLEQNYKYLFYEDNYDEIISLFKGFVESELKTQK